MEQLKHSKLISLNNNELTDIEGGGLAYDVGRALRFLGIDIINGGGPVGYSDAVADYIITQYNCNC